MALIDYEDKVQTIDQPSVPKRGKLTYEDANMIKNSVNGLYTALGLNENTYDSTSTYAVGDLVIYNNAIYECTTAITTAEEWTESNWTLVPIIVQ
jgi:hypothetical protein|nr:MAG TPA_asm: ChiA1-BD-binding domain protein [Caudoviricetes sp.]